MTPLYKPVRRRTGIVRRDRGKMRPIVVTMYPAGTLGLRLLGTRREETIPIEAVYERAVKMRVALEQAERAAKRKARRR